MPHRPTLLQLSYLSLAALLKMGIRVALDVFFFWYICNQSSRQSIPTYSDLSQVFLWLLKFIMFCVPEFFCYQIPVKTPSRSVSEIDDADTLLELVATFSLI